MRNKDYYDRHHLIPRNPYEEYEGRGNSVDNNIIKVKRNVHEAIHTLFTNKPPVSQIIELIKINDSCLDEKFKRDLIDCIVSNMWNWYNKDCYDWVMRAEMDRILKLWYNYV